MTQTANIQPDRRRANRAALNLAATMREGSRGKASVRLIDISTHGCRVEYSSTVAVDAWVWLNIASLESQYCRVVWHCQEFVGLEFEKPLADAVLDRLLENQKLPTQSRVNELRDIATRTLWLARQADDANIHPLAELSKACAVDAVVEGLRLGQAKSGGRGGKPATP
ncbi:PilZ domain-containing protein [Sphingomonas sp.]|uniref:PilZ domain-containing protein n=1 Tax=Sphingomonas sp. TaxID=28214 RepID=UPI00286B7910|nr:PilZ domain-containing protein [Sphingomonas sp.]